MKTIKRIFQMQLSQREMKKLKQIMAIVMIPMFILQMCSFNLLLMNVAVAEDGSVAVAENVEPEIPEASEPAEEPAPVIAPAPAVEPAPANGLLPDAPAILDVISGNEGDIVDSEDAAIVVPDPVVETPEVTPIPEITPVDPVVEEPKEEKTCLADDAEIKTSEEADWEIDGDEAKTKENVKLGVKYEFPGNKDVSVTFSCLPKETSKLKINQIKVEDINLPEGVNPATEFAYDITTGMENGDFEYDITLPKPEGMEAGVSYIEKSINEAKQEVKKDEVKIIEEKDNIKVDQNSNSNKVDIRGLEHFTIFIVTSPGPTLSTAMVNGMSYVSVPPSTNVKVTLKATTSGTGDDNDWESSQYSIDGVSWVCVNTPDHSSSGTYEENFTITAPAAVGSYDLSLRVYNGAGCTGGVSTPDLVLDDAIRVVTPSPSLTPPSLNNNSSDPVALTSVSGIWTDIDGGSGHQGIDSSEIRWGDPAGAQKSGLRFTNSGNQSFDTGDPFYLGMLTHMNWPTNAGTAANKATFQITLNFDRPDIPNVVLDYDFDIEETSNSTGNCKIYQRTLTPCDDRVTFPNSYGTQVFTIGDIQYTLVIDGFVDAYPSGNPVDAFVTEEQKDNSAFLVGHLSSVLVEKPEIRLTKKTNDQDVTASPGPNLYIGDTVEWQYIVQNSGNVALTGIALSDSDLGPITCPSTTIDSGATMTCTATGTVVAGQYENTATVVGTPPTGSNVSASDSSWYYGLEKGSIKIIKNSVPNSDQDFNFTSLNNSLGSFTLDDDGDNGNTYKNEIVFGNLPQGEHQITETPVAGWNPHITCVNDDHWSSNGSTAIVHVVPGEEVVCTFTNTLQTGTLTVIKEVNNDNGGTKTVGDFGINFSGGALTFNGGVGSGDTKTYTSQVMTLTAGNYTLSENDIEGYTEGTWDCGTISNGGKNTSIDLAAGQNMTCSITNDDQAGTLKVKKIISGGDADYVDFSFKINSGDDEIFESDGENEYQVNAGTYNIVENSEDGYTASYNNCSNVEVANGETETCTITNTRDTGKLKAIKTIDDGTALNLWSFKLGYGNWITADANGEVDFGQVLTFTDHTIYEKGPDGYHLSSASCTYSYTGNQDGSVTTQVAKGGTTICTFNNNVDKGTITIVKEADPKDAQNFGFTTTGTGLSSFPLDDDADGTLSNSETFSNLYPGGYSVTEDSINGWDLTNLSCVESGGQSVQNSTTNKNDRKVTLSLEAGESITCIFTNTKLGSISGMKWEDMDGDGTKDAEDLPISGWTIYLDKDADGTINQTTTTDASGNYSFGNLLPGTYKVLENTPSPWNVSYPSAGVNYYSGINLTAGAILIEYDFGNYKNGEIKGYKWEDIDGDGIKDGGEGAPNSQWQIKLWKEVNGVPVDQGKSASTDPTTGAFGFGVSPGTYYLSEVDQTGWTQTYPATEFIGPITVTSGSISENNNFGNFKNVSATVCKWEDPDGDINSPEGRTVIPGWSVSLIKNNDTANKDTKTTSANGCAQWLDLGPGSYAVIEEVQTGWTNLTPITNDFGTVQSGSENYFDFINTRDPYCGDGIVNGSEQCDGTAGVAVDGTEFCTSQCRRVPIYDGDHSCPTGTVEKYIASVALDSESNISQSLNLLEGNSYLLKASGIYQYAAEEPRKADPAYGTTDNFANWRPDIGIWGTNRGVTSIIGDLGRGVGVIEWDNDTNINSDHSYSKLIEPESDLTATFVISDWYGDWYGQYCGDQGCMGDNNGSLTLDLYECQPVAEVKVCKKDSLGNPLNGWNVALKGDLMETVNVLPNGNNYLSSVLTEGDYVLEANGTYEYRPGTPGAEFSDAQYSKRNCPSDGTICSGEYSPWANVNDFESSYQGYLGVKVNNALTNWGYYTGSEHKYLLGYENYSGQFQFNILDDVYSDNSGLIPVNIYKGYVGTTGEDGCATFADVPLGNYQVDEALKSGWEYISGRANVSVNDEKEEFILVNKEIPKPVKIEASKIVCTDESDLPNWGNGGPDITSATATDWIANHKSCSLESGWDFQWGDDGDSNPGDDHIGPASGWNNFDTATNAGGVASVNIFNIDNISQIKVRESLKVGYLPFSYTTNNYSNSDDVTAELYCDTDVVNYDNDDRFSPQYDKTYYCVAWNVQVDAKIAVDKNGPEFVKEGEPITYTYAVTNPGNLPLSNVSVVDDKCSPVIYIDGDTDGDSKLDLDETWNYNCTTTPTWAFNTQLENTATAEGYFEQTKVEASDKYKLYSFILRKDVKISEQEQFSDPDAVFEVEVKNGANVIGNVQISESNSAEMWVSEGAYDFCEINVPNKYTPHYPGGCLNFNTGTYPDWTHINYIKPVTISATKIVCNNESDLPNWGVGATNDITEITAQRYVADNPNCHLEEDWQFEWGYNDVLNPGDDFVGTAGNGWNTFESTVDIFNPTQPLKFREVLQENYLPFSYTLNGNTNVNNVSAEFYCGNDVVNYDNEEWLYNTEPGQTYYCVAWNVQLADIRGYKWSDLNGDGIEDLGEPKLSGWRIFIDEGDQNGQYDSGEKYMDTSDTNDDHFGWYWFENLLPGDYKVCEVLQNDWRQTYPTTVCHNVTLPDANPNGFREVLNYIDEPAPEYNFGNQQLAMVTVVKFDDLNGDGQKNDNEGTLSGWEINLSGQDSVDTNESGQVAFDQLLPGSYGLSETLQPDWNQTNIYCEDSGPGVLITQPGWAYGHHGACSGWNTCGDAATCAQKACEANGYQNLISYGDQRPCTQFNNCSLFYNINDDLSYEANWGNWCDVMGVTDIVCSDSVTPARAALIEDDSEASLVADNDYQLSLNAGDSKTCYIGNQFIAPELTIEKFNSQWPNVQEQGDVIDYTITVRASKNNVNSVMVTDLPPEGFEYLEGSWAASSSLGAAHDGNLQLSHAYASPGTWDLGNMQADEEITLTYKAQISSGQQPGTYNDLAWAGGTDNRSTIVLATSVPAPADDPGVITDNFVGTQIRLAAAITPQNVELDEDTETKTKTRTRYLPATGSSTWWIGLAIALLAVGAGLMIFSRRRRGNINDSKNMTSKIAMLVLMGTGIALLGFGNYAEAAIAPSIRLQQPNSPTNIKNLNISFVVLDVENRAMDVECWMDGPTDPATKFADVHVDAGGNSGVCPAVMTVDGAYDFFVEVTAGTDSANSGTSTVILNSQAPSTPIDYDRDGDSCNLTFTTANDGLTAKVELYRSTENEFTADASTFAKEVAIGPNALGSLSDPLGNCDDYLYAIRAVSEAGVGSDFVGDEDVNVRTRTRTRTRTVIEGTITGAIPVAAGTEGTVAGEETTNPEVVNQEEEEGEGTVLGEETATNENEKPVGITGFAKKYWPWALLLIAGGLIWYGFAKRKNDDQSAE